MTTSLGQALPGLVSTRAPSKPAVAAGKNEEPNFGDLVGDTERQSAQENQEPAETRPDDARWNRRASANPGKTQPDGNEPARTAALKPMAGKAAKDDAEDTEKASANAEPATPGATPFQDRLPLLMALNDIAHFSASAGTDGHDAATDGQAASDAVLDNQAKSSRQLLSALRKSDAMSDLETHDPGAVSRSERVSNAEAFPGKVRQPEAIGAVFKDLPRRDDGATAPSNDQAPADVSASPTRRVPASKTLEAIKSATSSGQGRQASSAARTDVIAEQSFPAPAQNPMSQTTSALIDALGSDNGLRQAFSTPSSGPQLAGSVAVPTHILKIELHPAELGMVTASLRLSGERLSIELKPETHEAHRRLAADSEAIVKSLRGLGFDVDKVTILQPSIADPAAGRTDASSALPMSAGREQPAFQPGDSSGNNAGSGGQQPGRNHSNDTQDFGRAASPARDSAGDGMFI
jgi:chemotaxis protein MotD